MGGGGGVASGAVEFDVILEWLPNEGGSMGGLRREVEASGAACTLRRERDTLLLRALFRGGFDSVDVKSRSCSPSASSSASSLALSLFALCFP